LPRRFSFETENDGPAIGFCPWRLRNQGCGFIIVKKRIELQRLRYARRHFKNISIVVPMCFFVLEEHWAGDGHVKSKMKGPHDLRIGSQRAAPENRRVPHVPQCKHILRSVTESLVRAYSAAEHKERAIQYQIDVVDNT
jgi:hypothetical protein